MEFNIHNIQLVVFVLYLKVREFNKALAFALEYLYILSIIIASNSGYLLSWLQLAEKWINKMKRLLDLSYQLLIMSCVLMFFMLISDQLHWHQLNFNFLVVLCSLVGVKLTIARYRYIWGRVLAWCAVSLGLAFAVHGIQLYFLVLCVFLWLMHNVKISLIDSSNCINMSIFASIRYLFYLIPVMYVSCWKTAMCIWGSRSKIDPYVVWVHLPPLSNVYDNKLCDLITAHSITLTPGTLVLKLEQNSILVHGLNVWSWQSLQDQCWYKNIRNIFASSSSVKLDQKI